MQGSGQLGGPIGPFRDPATGQMVNGTVYGNFTFVTQGADPASVQQEVQARLMHGIKDVLGQKLAQNQIAIPTISHSLPALLPEIIASSGVAQLGVTIQNVQLQANVENPSAVQAYGGPMPPTPMESMQNAFAQEAKDRLDPSNYEVRAKFNVGGLNIKASTDGGLDTDGIANQLKDKAKSQVIWWGIGCVVLLLLAVGALILVWYIYSTMQASAPGTKPTGKAETVAWDGTSTLKCMGNKNLRVEGVTANLSSGTAVSALGNCHLELVNVNITAPTGIEAIGTSVVTMKGGSITASKLAAKVMSGSEVRFEGTKVEGKTQALGTGKITGP